MKKLIYLNKICKSYKFGKKKILILDKITFEINYGQTLAIVGPSGIGKSTFLQILGTLEKIDSGQFFYKNKNITSYSDSKLACFRNKTVGFIFQFHYLLNDFSALENVMIPSLIARIGIKKAKIEAEKLLLKIGLKDRMNHRPRELSGGERQKVAVARAVILKPIILFADEPTGNLDMKSALEIQNILLELNRNFKIALILVTHSEMLSSVMEKKITILNGKIMNVIHD